MKRKVGDKVKIREDLVVNKQYGNISFRSYMIMYTGLEFEIEQVDPIGHYRLKNASYWWSDGMLKDIEPLPTCKKGDYLKGEDKNQHEVTGEFLGYYPNTGDYPYTIRTTTGIVDIKNPEKTEPLPIKPATVNNGLEGEFKEEWELDKKGRYYGYSFDFMGHSVMYSEVYVQSDLSGNFRSTPFFKTSKKLFLYLASLED